MKGLIKPTLTFLLLMLCRPGFGRLSEWSYETANDDITACTPAVRKGIEDFRKTYKDIHFECKGGYAEKLFAPKGSDIFSRPPEDFVKSYWSLFFPAKPKKTLDLRHQKQFDTKWQTTANQFYGGFEIWGAVTFWRSDVRYFNGKTNAPDPFGMLFVHLVDISNWTLKPRQRITVAAAEDRVREFDQKSGVKEEREYKGEHISYVLEDFCKKGPALVTRVDVWTHGGGNPNRGLKIIPVDAKTGEACAWK